MGKCVEARYLVPTHLWFILYHFVTPGNNIGGLRNYTLYTEFFSKWKLLVSLGCKKVLLSSNTKSKDDCKEKSI